MEKENYVSILERLQPSQSIPLNFFIFFKTPFLNFLNFYPLSNFYDIKNIPTTHSDLMVTGLPPLQFLINNIIGDLITDFKKKLCHCKNRVGFSLVVGWLADLLHLPTLCLLVWLVLVGLSMGLMEGLHLMFFPLRLLNCVWYALCCIIR